VLNSFFHVAILFKDVSLQFQWPLQRPLLLSILFLFCLSFPHKNIHIFFLFHTLSATLSLSHTHTHTLALLGQHIHFNCNSHTYINAHSASLTHTLSLSLTPIHALAHPFLFVSFYSVASTIHFWAEHFSSHILLLSILMLWCFWNFDLLVNKLNLFIKWAIQCFQNMY